MNIAIQGTRASFHHLASEKYFSSKSNEIIPCKTFEELCQQLTTGKAALAVMAIENTLAGSILPNYKLLQEFNIAIQGELYLKIAHHLMALPGTGKDDLEEIFSHPMALKQCRGFINKHPQIQFIEKFDTAGSAMIVRDQNLLKAGAIAPEAAAEEYGMEIIERDLQDLEHNFTRFLILEQKEERTLGSMLQNNVSEANKASLCFETGHAPGSLARVLKKLALRQINMTKIQSVPIPKLHNTYKFHIDIEWGPNTSINETMYALDSVSKDLLLMGIYKSGKSPYEV